MNSRTVKHLNGGNMYRNHRWLVLAGTALFAAACAQSNGDINRVQPNVVKKADLLDGQWYFRNTVTWTPATTGFTFAGETGNLEKIVWEIQEKYLVGYRAYPLIPGNDSNVEVSSRPSGTTTKLCGADGKCSGGHQYFGTPVVAYPIQSHFDIQRSFNPSTGEPGNVIDENGSDRPWNQREFIRVDWSANLLNKGKEMVWNTLQNPAGATDYNAWIQPNEPGTDPYDWPSFEYDANGKLTYFDFTGRYLAAPETYYYEPYDTYFPICFFLDGYRYDCTSQEIRMRTSISKIDPNKTNDYEPLVYSDDVMQKFGYFRTERLNYDRKFGPTESARILLANRHRIWESYYTKDSNGVPNANQPIPVKDRTPKPVVYYVSPKDRMGVADSYEVFLESARELEKSWDRAFRRAVAAAKGVSDYTQVPQMFVVCENPVPAGANPACGPAGFEPKFGDLRYNFLYTITDPVPNGLLGYGPSSADPETGEIISANANTYSGAVDVLAQRGLDVIDVLVGEKSVDDIIRGEDVKAYMEANLSYARADSVAMKHGKLQSELQGIPQTNLESVGAFQRPTERTAAILQGLKMNGGLPRYTSDRVKTAADLLEKNPAVESAVLDNAEIQQDILGLLPRELVARAETDSSFRRDAARSVLTRIGDKLARQRERVEWASRRNIYLAEYMDRPVLALAQREHRKRLERVAQLTAQGSPLCENVSSCTTSEARRIADDEIRRRLRQAIWRGTSEHEVGHTLGLRHNFQGTFDAVNFHDQYWDLRKETLTVEQSGAPKIPRTPGDLKAASDGTETQLVGGMFEYEYSSIMDYHAKLSSDTHGIGKYDEAAIIFAYSGDKEPGYVEVFQSARRDPKAFPGSDGRQLTVTGAAFDLPVVNAQHRHQAIPNYVERFHYSLVPLHFGEGADLTSTIEDGLQKLKQRRLMKWSEVRPHHDRIRELLHSNPNPTPADVGDAPLEVPYMFCSDYEVGAVLSCARFDRGADYYEISRQFIEDYWNQYFFTHFKRDRYWFTSDGAFNSSFGTFYDLANVYKHWVNAFYGQTSATQQDLGRYQYDPLIQDTWSMAVLDAANANLQVMSVPPAGFYMYRDFGNGRKQWDIISEGIDFDEFSPEGAEFVKQIYSNPQYVNPPAQKFAIAPRGQARRMYSRYDYKSGHGFWYRMVEAGHYNDQIGAMFASVIPDAEFLGVDYYADRDRYSIPYYLVFKKEFGSTFGALWSVDEDRVRPTMYLTLDGAGNPTERPTMNFQNFVRGQDYIGEILPGVPWAYPKVGLQPCQTGQTSGCLRADQWPAPANVQTTWTSRIYALYLGMALFSVNYDLDYAKSNLIYKVGSSEQVSIAPGYHAVEMPDPIAGGRYVAIEKDGAPPVSTPALRLLAMADAYRQVVEDPAMCPYPSIPNGDGTSSVIDSCMPPADRTNPVKIEEKRREYTEYFQDTVRDIDLARGMYNIYGRAF